MIRRIAFPAALGTALAALLAQPALAQDDRAHPGDWTVLGDSPGGPAAGPDVPQPGLWLPMGPPAAARGVPLGDALGRHAAVVFAPSSRSVVEVALLSRDLRAALLLDWRRATLTPAGGEPVAASSGDAWVGKPAGRETIADSSGGGFVTWHIPFPALDPGWSDLTFSVPVADDVPLVLRFARWRELVAAAESDLEAWKRHIAATRAASAIGPYLDDDGYRRLVSRGEAVVAPLLLRELARGEERRDASAVPRFLVLHVIAGTAWGRQAGVPDHGDAAVARRILERWRSTGVPAVPGVSPFERGGRR